MDTDQDFTAPTAKKPRGRPAARSMSQSSPDEDTMPIYLTKFMAQLNASLATFKSELVTEIKSALEKSVSKPVIDSLANRVDSIMSKSFANVVTATAPKKVDQKATYAQVLAANRDLEKYPEKNYQAVICNFPEHDDPEKTLNEDRTFLGTLFRESSLKKKWEEGEIQYFRHPKDAPRNSKRQGRPIKLKFPTAEYQVQFLKEANQIRRNTFPTLHHVFARRDLNPTELQIDQDLRKECGIRNQECGLIKYVVRDLEVYTIKNPKIKISPRARPSDN